MKRSILFFVVVLVLALKAGSAFATTYTYTPLGTNLPFLPTGINDSGVIVGQSPDENTMTVSSYIVSGGNFNPFNVPGAQQTAVTGINNSGQIVGTYIVGNTGGNFVYANGSFTTSPGTDYRYTSISNNGTILATSSSGGLLINGSSSTPLAAYPGAANTYYSSLTDSGLIAGSYSDGTYQHGFLLDSRTGIFQALPGYAGARDSYLWSTGINNSGVISANANPGAGLLGRGFLLDGSNFTNLDYPGADQTLVSDINNRGQIIGSFNLLGEPYPHGYLATPIDSVPEPFTLVPLSAGMLMFAWFFGRRKKAEA